MTENNDYSLIQACLRGEAFGFEELLNRYKNRIFSFAMRMVKNSEDAEDIAHEAFIKAFRSLNSYNSDYPFITWLFKITHNKCLDFLRVKKPNIISFDDDNVHFEPEDTNDSPEKALNLKIEYEEAENLLMSLPLLYRETLLLQYREDMTCKQISEIMGIPEGTVKIRLFRGKAMIKERFKTPENITR
ncbi:MAG: RNA polymerase sigma factor [Elusimicrobiales bacterium]|nr:RNA polymerase sigma factor [Elusimicrobiales bacterium]